uniref:Uncharacterized protein n=1 Tax=Setaria italica TaxID=4555 RepID=K3YF97_SETIT
MASIVFAKPGDARWTVVPLLRQLAGRFGLPGGAVRRGVEHVGVPIHCGWRHIHIHQSRGFSV